MSYIRKRANSFSYAFSGIGAVLKEPNMKIHFIATLVVIGTAFYFRVSVTDWCILIICCSLVISLEMLNSAIEKLCDVVEPNPQPKIKFVKDVAAGAVLIAAIASAVIGTIIFYGYFIKTFS